MIHSKTTFHAILAILVSLGMSVEPNRVLANSEQLVAQASEAKTSFPLLDKLPDGSVITISGTENTAQINSSLEEKFENKYNGSAVEVDYQDSDAALAAVTEQKADLAAISRPLTDEEKAQGFKSVPLSREKIAIIVGADNTFEDSLTIEQFAKIFRGEITNWSEVGGADQEIKLVDRSTKNDTRRSFPSYPVFQSADFSTGANATVVESVDTSEVASQLGADGISYAPVSAVGDLEGVKVVTMHQTLPDDPRYPFSQPNMYVYQGDPSPAAQGFLGFVTDKSGQDVIKNTLATATPLAGLKAGIAAKAPKVDVNAPKIDAKAPDVDVNAPKVDVNAPKIDAKAPDVDVNAPKVDVNAPKIDAKAPDVDVNAPKVDVNAPDVDVNAPKIKTRSVNWLWFLLPLAFLIPLLAFLIKKGKEVSTTRVDTKVRERELVGSGATRTTSRRGDNNNGLATGAGIAGAGIAGATIANRKKGGVNLPDMPDVDMPNVDMPNVGGAVDGVKNKFGEVTGKINTPDLPNVDMPNVGGAVDGVKNKFGEVTSEGYTPEMPELNDIKTNFETPELPELNDISTSFETPNLPNAGNAIDGIKGKAGDAFDGLKDNLNPNDSNLNADGLFDSIKDKAGDLKDNLGNKASDLKDDLTDNGNH